MDTPFAIYDGLSTPTVIADADYRLVYLNPSAERFWQIESADATGQLIMAGLRLSSPDGRDTRDWVRDVGFPAVSRGDPFTCRTTWPDGRDAIIRVSVTRFHQDAEWYTLLTVLPEAGSEAPDWALTDALTALHNRHQWDREFPARNARAGAVIFLDLDSLKQINDLNGHRQGDQALIITGRAIRQHTPAGGLAVRYGGDEFVVVMHDCEEESARAVAERIVSSVAEAETVSGGVPVHVSFGLATYGPGGLLRAVERADEALYERRGVLLRSAQGGRILLTSEARGRVLPPGSDAGKAGPGEYAKSFGSQFDGYFRQMYARAVEQAREFVEFVAPQPGSAVVEVGAGSGRITFDGGLAERVGERGQLLVTDPSPAQLQVARQRAESLGLSWVRFLPAAVEDVPIASNSVDLVLGAAFLHFTDEAAAIRSLARIVRPGGRVALFAGLNMHWGPAWERAVEPIREALREHGLAFRDLFLPREQLEALFVDAGLVIERFQLSEQERLIYPTTEIAVGIARQARSAALLSRALPAEVQTSLEGPFEAALRQAIDELGPEATESGAAAISILARKPA